MSAPHRNLLLAVHMSVEIKNKYFLIFNFMIPPIGVHQQLRSKCGAPEKESQNNIVIPIQLAPYMSKPTIIKTYN